MKILFIGSKSFDYLQDLTYTGLIKLFGFDNVIEYRWNKKYHLNTYKYPKNIGYIPKTTFGSIFKNKKDYNVVFIASAKIDCFEIYYEMMDSIPTNIPVVFIDGGDREEIGGDLSRLGNDEIYQKVINKRGFDYIFKREYFDDREYAKNIFPLPFSYNFNKTPTLELSKIYNVTFWAVESHEIRTKVLTMIENKFDCKSNGTILNQTFKNYDRKGDKYLQELSRAKITLNFRGVGWDTLRYWEVPAIGGFMISGKPKIVIPKNFVDGKHVVFCEDDLSDLIELCEYYVKHDDERETIAKQALSYAKEYHSDIARTKYIFEAIKI